MSYTRLGYFRSLLRPSMLAHRWGWLFGCLAICITAAGIGGQVFCVGRPVVLGGVASIGVPLRGCSSAFPLSRLLGVLLRSLWPFASSCFLPPTRPSACLRLGHFVGAVRPGRVWRLPPSHPCFLQLLRFCGFRLRACGALCGWLGLVGRSLCATGTWCRQCSAASTWCWLLFPLVWHRAP